MIKFVLFDWGGVLAYGGHSFWKTIQEMLGVKIDEKHMAEYKKLRIGINTGRLTEEEFAAGFNNLTGAEVSSAVWNIQEIVSIRPEMEEFVRGLKSRGLRVGIISNMNKMTASSIRKRGGYNSFDMVINSCDVGVLKPSPEIYDIALQKIGATPDDCVFIDDLAANLVYPESIGVKTVLAVSPNQTIRDVESLVGEA